MTPLASPCLKRHHSPRLTSGKGWSCPDCEAGAQVSDQHRALSAALDARDRGMSVATSAHPNEAARVREAVRQLLATGRPFSANEARLLHGVRGGVVGATFNALKSEGVIKPIDEVTSTDKGTHGKRVLRYVAA